jgi:hypothetical protein
MQYLHMLCCKRGNGKLHACIHQWISAHKTLMLTRPARVHARCMMRACMCRLTCVHQIQCPYG